MAKVIVAVDEPRSLLPENLGRSKLFLGSYVRVEIDGTTLNDVYPLKRAHLRDNSSIWLLSPDSTLEIRPVSPVFKGPSAVLLKDEVREGEKLIVSTIPTPVAGMKVRLEGSSPGPGRRGPQDKKSRPEPSPSIETPARKDKGTQKEGEVHARQ